MDAAVDISPATLSFFGAAGTVTGSKFLVRAAGRQVLLDCGLFQGLKALRLRNWEVPPFQPEAIDAVVLSHGHLDHSGQLPLLVKRGFRGPICCTPATADLLRVLLLDAAHLQEEDAARANRYRYSKHSPALPLYTVADAEAVLEQLEPRGYEHPFAVVDGVEARLRRAGHILGSATVELLLGDGSGARLVYSGDLGRRARPILRDPEPVPSADILLVESTYGDREHAGDAREQLARVVLEAVDRGGALSAAAGLVSTIHEQLRWRVSAASDGECVVL